MSRMKPFNKVVRIGTLSTHGGGRVSVYFHIKNTTHWSDKAGNWSFTGVVGPRSSGNAYGGCGQIDMEFEHKDPAQNDSRYSHLIKPEHISFAPGWDAESLYRVLDLWHKYHMKPAGEMPLEDRKFLRGLPTTDRSPAWV